MDSVILRRRLIATLPAILMLVSIFLPAVPAAAAAYAPDMQRWHIFTTANGLAGNSVQSFWEDTDGHIWMGTGNGVSHYDGATWTTYRTEEGLLDNNVWSISGDADSVWFATTNGLSVLDQGRWRSYTTADGLPGNDVRAVLVARDGTVWVGTFGLGIAYLNPGATTWERLEFPDLRFAGLSVTVQDIWQDADGTVWFSTNAFGALRLNGTEFEQFTFRDGQRNTIWSVGAEATSNLTWLGTFKGIVQVNADDTVVVPDDIVGRVPLASTEVLAVAGGTDDLWFGTRAQGVLHRADGVWRHYSTRDGLSQDYVQAILVDRAGRVWFGTRGGGVTMLTSAPLHPEQLHPQISGRDVSSDTVLPQPAAVLDSSQNNLQFHFSLNARWLPPQDVQFRYWLESADPVDTPPDRATVQTVRPVSGSRIVANSEVLVDLVPGSYILYVTVVVGSVESPPATYAFTLRSAPPVLMADTLHMRSAGQRVEQGLTLPPSLFAGTRQVHLHLDADDDVTAPEQLQYRYRVNTLTDTWHLADNPTISLWLPHGQHQIDVQVRDSDDNLSEPLTMTIIVPAPLWQTFLFYMLLITLPAATGGIGGAVGYRRWSRQQALRRAVRGYLIPYDVGSLITMPDRYIGRQHILDTVLGKLTTSSFYIYGEKRIGKTSLLLQLKQRLLQRNRMQHERRYVPVFRNMQDLPEAQFWLYLVRSIAAEMPALPAALLALSERTAGYDDLDAESDLELLVNHMQQSDGASTAHSQHVCIVLLLDEVDTLQRYDPAVRQRFRAFCQHMQRHMRVVLAGVLPPHGDATETSPWYNIFEPLSLGPLAPNDILYLIRHYNDNPYTYTPEAEQAIIHASDGKPFDAQWLCSEAVKAMLAEQRTSVLLPDVEQAVATLVRERSTEYVTLWRQVTHATRQELAQAAQGSGTITTARLAHRDRERLLDAGLVSGAEQGYRLTALFQHWIEAQDENQSLCSQQLGGG
jgi:hypothetical protein